MPITDDLNHYASIVSWKVKQQTQILRVQAQIHDLESQIGIQKTILGERAYELFSQGSISGTNLAAEEPIRQTCEKISALIAEKAERQQELSLLRAQTLRRSPKPQPRLRPPRQRKQRMFRSRSRRGKHPSNRACLKTSARQRTQRSRLSKVGSGWT